MLPIHYIDTTNFLLGFNLEDPEKYEELQRTFGIKHHTIVKCEQTSNPNDSPGKFQTIIQYVTTKEIVCSIDVDILLYNELTGKKLDFYWFDFYASGTRPIKRYINTSQSANTFTDIVRVYNNNGGDVGDPEYFRSGDDKVLEDGEGNYICGYYMIPETSKFSFSEVIAYDKAYVKSEAEVQDNPGENDFDYRYKALIMYVDMDGLGIEKMRISFGVIILVNNKIVNYFGNYDIVTAINDYYNQQNIHLPV